MAALAEAAKAGHKSLICPGIWLQPAGSIVGTVASGCYAGHEETTGNPSMKPSISVAMHGDQIREILERFRMRNPKIFGSAARGDDTEDSDLDILVEVPPGATFYDLARAELELESVLGCKVEVLTRDSLALDVVEEAEADLAPIP
jgi:uncharacterized protein